MKNLWNSRKFRILIVDTVIALIVTLAGWFFAPDVLDKILIVIGILQAPVVAVIGGIAYEDGQEKSAFVGFDEPEE